MKEEQEITTCLRVGLSVATSNAAQMPLLCIGGSCWPMDGTSASFSQCTLKVAKVLPTVEKATLLSCQEIFRVTWYLIICMCTLEAADIAGGQGPGASQVQVRIGSLEDPPVMSDIWTPLPSTSVLHVGLQSFCNRRGDGIQQSFFFRTLGSKKPECYLHHLLPFERSITAKAVLVSILTKAVVRFPIVCSLWTPS